MNIFNLKEEHSFFGRNLNIYLTALASVPLWTMISAYVNAIHVHEDELTATVGTASFLLGVFVGRYLTQFWAARLKSTPVTILVILSTLIVACTGWLFLHADFPLNHVGLNLLLFWVPFCIISVALGVVIKILRAITQNKIREAQAAAATSKSELHLLQSQLSPHFLFNTLNNLYGLSISQHEKIPPLLLKLSELLRYSVYDAGEAFVPLKDEITYINNYIEFEKIRIGDRLVLKTDFGDINSNEIRIAPMLLIVFIENAFKHSKNTVDDKIYVDISLKTWANSILFTCRNSYSKQTEESAVVNKHSGFGLASVLKRLELLYLNDHELQLETGDGFYEVHLQVKIKK